MAKSFKSSSNELNKIEEQLLIEKNEQLSNTITKFELQFITIIKILK